MRNTAGGPNLIGKLLKFGLFMIPRTTTHTHGIYYSLSRAYRAKFSCKRILCVLSILSVYYAQPAAQPAEPWLNTKACNWYSKCWKKWWLFLNILINIRLYQNPKAVRYTSNIHKTCLDIILFHLSTYSERNRDLLFEQIPTMKILRKFTTKIELVNLNFSILPFLVFSDLCATHFMIWTIERFFSTKNVEMCWLVNGHVWYVIY